MSPPASRPVGTGRREPVVVDAFHRGIDIYRPVAALYAVYLAWGRYESMARPWVAAVVLAVMVAWSLAMLVVRRRTRGIVATEIMIAVVGILATMWSETPAAIQAGQFTIPTLWAAGPVACAAVVAGARGGVAAALVISVADLVEVGRPTQATIHNIVLLFLLGGLIGLAVDLARTGLLRYEQALLEQERLHERERIARVVHDGVLQSLAYIHRKGAELGGPAFELAELAAEQERSLRRFVSGTSGGDQPLASADLSGQGAPELDLRRLLADREGPATDVSVPADPVLVDAVVAREVDAAVAAALDNVARHAGQDAHAWILLEGDVEGIRLTVRDNGVGADAEDLLGAVGRGRMGVASSIRGRIEDLGGTATWSTRPGGGCVVTLVVPRSPQEAP